MFENTTIDKATRPLKNLDVTFDLEVIQAFIRI